MEWYSIFEDEPEVTAEFGLDDDFEDEKLRLVVTDWLEKVEFTQEKAMGK